MFAYLGEQCCTSVLLESFFSQQLQLDAGHLEGSQGERVVVRTGSEVGSGHKFFDLRWGSFGKLQKDEDAQDSSAAHIQLRCRFVLEPK